MPGDNDRVPAPQPLDVTAPTVASRPGRRRRSRTRRVVSSLLILLVLAVLAPVAWAFATVLWTARADDRTPTDAIVVLGASQFWGTPSPVFANRLDHARELYDDGMAPLIVTLGGGQPGDRTTEAESGRQYLINAGVPATDVVAVPYGSDTYTSMSALSRTGLAAMSGKPVQAGTLTLVSDPAHLARSAAVARFFGLDPRVSGTVEGPGSSVTPEYVVRETAGLLRLWFYDSHQSIST